jgi:hypothetical protein
VRLRRMPCAAFSVEPEVMTALDRRLTEHRLSYRRAQLLTRGRALLAFALSACVWLPQLGLAASAESLPPADQFISMLKLRDFKGAAEEFYVPPTYSGERLVKERASIAHGLTFLFGEVGDIETATRELVPRNAEWWVVGQSGGDRPYSASEIGATGEVRAIYAVKVRSEPRAQIVVVYVHLPQGWRILRFQFGIPRDDPGAEARWKTLALKIYESARSFHAMQDAGGI